jgi:hypothetical protein
MKRKKEKDRWKPKKINIDTLSINAIKVLGFPLDIADIIMRPRRRGDISR